MTVLQNKPHFRMFPRRWEMKYSWYAEVIRDNGERECGLGKTMADAYESLLSNMNRSALYATTYGWSVDER